jgi:hypothetical protein
MKDEGSLRFSLKKRATGIRFRPQGSGFRLQEKEKPVNG